MLSYVVAIYFPGTRAVPGIHAFSNEQAANDCMDWYKLRGYYCDLSIVYVEDKWEKKDDKSIKCSKT